MVSLVYNQRNHKVKFVICGLFLWTDGETRDDEMKSFVRGIFGAFREFMGLLFGVDFCEVRIKYRIMLALGAMFRNSYKDSIFCCVRELWWSQHLMSLVYYFTIASFEVMLK